MKVNEFLNEVLAAAKAAGIDPADLIGIHTYCRDADIEVIDARYLRKV